MSTPAVLGLIAAKAAVGCALAWHSQDPGFTAHLAACLSEGLCPHGHPLELPGELIHGRVCRRCEPVSYWLAAPPGSWLWSRWPE